jgi:3-oxoacyl-[acyl-carrier-protein] synthase III
MSTGSRPIGLAYRVPKHVLTHQEIQRRYGTEVADKIAISSGIFERRVVAADECASDLAVAAAEDLIAGTGVARDSIDLLVYATQTPDYLLPTTACLIQRRLGLRTSLAAFDVNLGCSQYVYSLAIAHAMISAGMAKRALVMTGDTVSRIIHPEDRAVVPLFGDAGTATLLEATQEPDGFRDFVLGTDGGGGDALIWPTSGLREPRTTESAVAVADSTGAVRSRDDMYMEGAKVFLFTLKTVPDLVRSLVARNSMAVDDVDLFIFHQASELIVNSAARRLGIPEHKLHFKLHDVGNSGGSTVNIALTDAWLAGRVKPGMRIVLVAFGVGLSWGASLLIWPQDGFLGAQCLVDYSASPPKPAAQGGPK